MLNFILRGWVALFANRRIWLFMYLTKLCLALVVTLPVLFTIQSAMNNSLYATPLLKEWSLKVIGEVIVQRPFLFGQSFSLLIVFAVVVWVLRMFLNGGIYKAYAGGLQIGLSDFFSEAGRRFGIHIRITGLMVIMYLVCIGVGMLCGSFVGRAVLALLPNSGNLALACWLGCIGLVITPAVVFSDTLRAATVNSDIPTVRALLPQAFGYYRSHWVQMIGAYLMIFVPFVIIWGVVELSALAITGALANKAGVMFELVLFQACSCLRVGQSLLFTASVARSYQSQTKVIPQVEVIKVPS